MSSCDLALGPVRVPVCRTCSCFVLPCSFCFSSCFSSSRPALLCTALLVDPRRGFWQNVWFAFARAERTLTKSPPAPLPLPLPLRSFLSHLPRDYNHEEDLGAVLAEIDENDVAMLLQQEDGEEGVLSTPFVTGACLTAALFAGSLAGRDASVAWAKKPSHTGLTLDSLDKSDIVAFCLPSAAGTVSFFLFQNLRCFLCE